jgi:hypothetical protein
MVTNFGAMGDADIGGNFVWNGGDVMFDGTFIMGTDETNLALDVFDTHDRCCIMPDGFLTLKDTFECTQDGGPLGQVARGAYLHDNGLDLRVEEVTYAIGDIVGDNFASNFVLKEFTVENIGAATITDIQLGEYADWDVGDAYTNNVAANAAKNIFYHYDPADANFIFGMIRLPNDDPAYGYFGVDNPTYIYPVVGWVDDSLDNCMDRAGVDLNAAAQPEDMSGLLTMENGLSLDPDATHTEYVCIFGLDLNNWASAAEFSDLVHRFAGFGDPIVRGDVNDDGAITGMPVQFTDFSI